MRVEELNSDTRSSDIQYHLNYFQLSDMDFQRAVRYKRMEVVCAH